MTRISVHNTIILVITWVRPHRFKSCWCRYPFCFLLFGGVNVSILSKGVWVCGKLEENLKSAMISWLIPSRCTNNNKCRQRPSNEAQADPLSPRQYLVLRYLTMARQSTAAEYQLALRSHPMPVPTFISRAASCEINPVQLIVDDTPFAVQRHHLTYNRCRAMTLEEMSIYFSTTACLLRSLRDSLRSYPFETTARTYTAPR